MNKNIFNYIIISYLSLSSIWGQTYFNNAYELQNEIIGANIVNGQYVDNQIRIGIFHFNDQEDGVESSIATIQNNQIEVKRLSDIACGLDCLLYDGSNIYIHGNSNLQENHANLIKLDSGYDYIWNQSYGLDGEYGSNKRAKISDDKTYLFSLSDVTVNPDKRITNLRKLDQNGGEIWSKYFGYENVLNYPWDLDIALDQNVFIATGIVEGIGRYGEIKRLDNSGSEIWTTRLPEVFPNGGTHMFLSVLANGNLAVHAERELVEGEHFFYKDPVMIYILDQAGNILSDTTLLNNNPVELTFSEIIAGRGEYFFAFGHEVHRWTDEFWGVIYKFSNDGELIWKRKYRHPDYISDSFLLTYNIDDLIELESGDLISIGQITGFGEAVNLAWTMRLSEDGCLSEGDCTNEVITSTSEISISPQLQVRIHLENENISVLSDYLYDISTVTIYDLYGHKIQTENCSDDTCDFKLNIDNSGIYIVNVKFVDGMRYSEKFFKN